MSVSTAPSPNPTLPPELMEKIVRQIKTEPTLLTCSQVSRTLEHYSFRQLFRYLHTCCDEMTVGTFRRLMPRSRRIFQYVEELRIGCPVFPHESSHQQLCQVLELFVEHSDGCLEKIVLRRISWGQLTDSLRIALMALLAYPSVKTLEFEYVNGFPLAAFRHVSSGLKTFRTTNTECNLDLLDDAPEDASITIPAARPEQLIISSKGNLASHLIDRVPNSLDVSHLALLTMAVRFKSDWELMQKLMQNTSNTLECVSVTFQSVPPSLHMLSNSMHDQLHSQDDTCQLNFDLGPFLRLRNIEFWAPLFFSIVNPILRGLHETLCSLSDGSRLERITFFIYLEPRHPIKLTDSKWGELDLELASVTLRAAQFQHVKFHIARFMGQSHDEQLRLYAMTTGLLSEKLPVSFQKKLIVTERTTQLQAWPLYDRR